MEISRKDKGAIFSAYAAEAASQAKKATSSRDSDTWAKIAELWADLAAFKAEGNANFGRRLGRPLNLSAQAFLPTTVVGGFKHFSIPIVCEGCGQEGIETWEIVSPAGGGKLDIQFVARTGEFYERISRIGPHPIEVVCQGCGTVMTEPT